MAGCAAFDEELKSSRNIGYLMLVWVAQPHKWGAVARWQVDKLREDVEAEVKWQRLAVDSFRSD